MNRIDWLVERQNGIGGSDAAAAVGLSPWKTPYQLYLDKTTPIAEEEDGIEAFLWGHLIEPVIRQRYCDIHDCKVMLPDGPVIHSEHSFARCNPDGIVVDDDDNWLRTLQIKNWGFGKEQWGEYGSSDIPEHYMIQVQHEIACCNVPFADVAVLFHGNEYREYVIERNDALIEQLMDAEAKFWDHVERRDPPECENLDDVAARWKSVLFTGQYVEGDDACYEAWLALGDVRDQIKELEKRKDAYELVLKQQIKDTEGIEFDGQKLATWKEQSQVRFDAKGFQAEHPELFEQFKKPTTFRKFLYKKGKKR